MEIDEEVMLQMQNYWQNYFSSQWTNDSNEESKRMETSKEAELYMIEYFGTKSVSTTRIDEEIIKFYQK